MKPSHRKRRDKERHTPPAVKRKWLQDLLYEQDWKCALCGEPIEVAEMANLDHIIPLSCGGPHKKLNMQATHIICNQQKGNGHYGVV